MPCFILSINNIWIQRKWKNAIKMVYIYCFYCAANELIQPCDSRLITYKYKPFILWLPKYFLWRNRVGKSNAGHQRNNRIVFSKWRGWVSLFLCGFFVVLCHLGMFFSGRLPQKGQVCVWISIWQTSMETPCPAPTRLLRPPNFPLFSAVGILVV